MEDSQRFEQYVDESENGVTALYIETGKERV